VCHTVGTSVQLQDQASVSTMATYAVLTPPLSSPQPRPSSRRKRSTSQSLSSILSSFTSLTSSSSTSPAVSPNSLAPTATSTVAGSGRKHDGHGRPSFSRRNTQPSTPDRRLIKTNTPSPPKMSTPMSQAPVSASRSNPNSPFRDRPDVFSFMEKSDSGSSTPTGRSKPGLKALAKQKKEKGSRPVSRERTYTAPLPVRPALLPRGGNSWSFDSGTGSTPRSWSPADTPHHGDDELEQLPPVQWRKPDAVGRSMQPDDYYRSRPRSTRKHSKQSVSFVNMGNDRYTPPAAPFPPMEHSSSPVMSYPMSPQYFMPSPPQATVPYPTPPLETLQSVPNEQVSPSPSDPSHLALLASAFEPEHKSINVMRPNSTNEEAGANYLYRSYRSLTDSTLKRMQITIEALEDELDNLDRNISSSQHTDGQLYWQRDRVFMKLCDTLTMHHRLLHACSKIAHLKEADLSRVGPELKAILAQKAHDGGRQMSLRSKEGKEGLPHELVKDLVCISEEAQQRTPGVDSSPRSSLILLAGTAIFIVATQEGAYLRFVLGLITFAGIYALANDGFWNIARLT